jgi:hypothetical protein
VGALAAAIVIGEVLRRLNGGEHFDVLEARLESPHEFHAIKADGRQSQNIDWQRVNSLVSATS